jgi:hypothetical protein
MSSKKVPEQPPAEPRTAPMIMCRQPGEQPSQSESRQCGAVKTDGERCQAQALHSSSSCYFHDPESAEDRIAASKRGGEKRRSATLPSGTPDFPLASATDASALIGWTINHLLRGEIDPKIANAVGYLVTVKIKATDAGILERRLDALEAALHDTNSDAEKGGSV